MRRIRYERWSWEFTVFFLMFLFFCLFFFSVSSTFENSHVYTAQGGWVAWMVILKVIHIHIGMNFRGCEMPRARGVEEIR